MYLYRFLLKKALLLLLFFPFIAMGQSADCIFKGTIIDSTTNTALEKAIVRLFHANDTVSLICLTAHDGSFEFSHVRSGQIVIETEHTGYTTRKKYYFLPVQSSLQFTDTIRMMRAVGLLENVTVTSTKRIIENRPDKLIYNTERDITSQGGTATDILRKVPQVSVDINGNVELLGNPSVRFLINGKPSAMFGNNVAEALQSIPAAQIQSIEVISSPGAKYDASGTGGIINIIMKKNRARGFSGVLNGSAGTRLENGSLNMFYKKNNLSLSSYFNSSTQIQVRTQSQLNRNAKDTSNDNSYYLTQTGTSDYSRNTWRTGIGLDWDISAKDNFSLTLANSFFNNSNDGQWLQDNSGKTMTGTILYSEQAIRDAATKVRNSTTDLSADYKRILNKEKEEQLTIGLNYSNGHNDTWYNQSQRYITDNTLFAGSSSKNPGRDNMMICSLDYVVTLKNKIGLETGIKWTGEKIRSDARVLSYSPGVHEFISDDAQSYTSDFNRNVYGTYLSLSFTLFSKLKLITGSRYEYTTNHAVYSNSGVAAIPDYSNFGPSVTLMLPLKKETALRFSYAYRLERPEFRDLNPFVNLADPHNMLTGNPYIKPEIGRDFQLGYTNNFGKDNMLNVLLLYTYNSPDIKSFTSFYPYYQVGDSVYENVNVTRRSNIASEKRYGLSFSGAFNAGQHFSLRPNIQFFERQVTNIYDLPVKKSGFEYRGNINITSQLSKELTAEFFISYRSGIKWQGRQPGFYSYSTAFRQQLFKGKGSIGLVAVNLFAKFLKQATTQETYVIHTTSVLNIPYRSFGINFLYKFGKIKVKAREAENLLNRPPVEGQ